MIARRPVLAGLAIALLGGRATAATTGSATVEEIDAPYGMIGKIVAVAGQRAALIGILGSGNSAMPGCLAYLIAEDAADPDAIWITEIWMSKASHRASLALPSVKAAIAKGRPLIKDFPISADTRPVHAASFVAARKG